MESQGASVEQIRTGGLTLESPPQHSDLNQINGSGFNQHYSNMNQNSNAGQMIDNNFITVRIYFDVVDDASGEMKKKIFPIEQLVKSGGSGSQD